MCLIIAHYVFITITILEKYLISLSGHGSGSKRYYNDQNGC